MMAKVRQAFGETRFVPWIGRDVQDGEVLDVPDGELAGYLEGGWEPADKATVAVQQQLLADKAAGKPGITVGMLKAKSKPTPAAEPDDPVKAVVEDDGVATPEVEES